MRRGSWAAAILLCGAATAHAKPKRFPYCASLSLRQSNMAWAARCLDFQNDFAVFKQHPLGYTDVDDVGHTALYYAANSGQVELMALLEERGASGAYALSEKKIPLPKEFEEFSRIWGASPAYFAPQAVKDYMALAVDPNKVFSDGRTVLESFGQFCDVDSVRLMLALGAKTRFGHRGDFACGKYPEDFKVAMRAALDAKRLPFADAKKLLRLDEISGTDKAELSRGLLVWIPQRRDWALPLMSHGDWERVSELASDWAREDAAAFAGTKPAAVALEQDRYESSAQFEARVASAKKEFDAAQTAYDAKLAAYPAWRRAAILRHAISLVFGVPAVSKTSYDPDARLFSAEVVPTRLYAHYFSQAFVLKEPVPNDEAAEFEKALKSVEPVVTFQSDGDKISVASAVFRVRGKDYEALPAGGLDAKPLASIDLGGGAPAAPAALSIRYADNPKLAEKLAELEKLKKQNAEQSELEALQAQIDALKKGEAKTYSSDVDAAPSAAAAARPHDFAVVVGIENYQKKELPAASFAERDADAVAVNLAARGVPKENIILLKGSAATLAHLKNKLESWLPKNVGPDSTVYFYFSGHGAPDAETGRAYLVPWDSEPSYLKTSGLALSDLYGALANLKVKHTLVATDACFSGSGERSVGVAGARPLITVRADEVPAGVTAIAAAASDQIARSLDDQGHGAFTYYFLKGLRGGAKDTDALCASLSDSVKAAAARQNGVQTPVCKGPDFAFQ